MERLIYKNKEEELEHKWQIAIYLAYHDFFDETELTEEDIEGIMEGRVHDFFDRRKDPMSKQVYPRLSTNESIVPEPK
jgi:hypothetical protein